MKKLLILFATFSILGTAKAQEITLLTFESYTFSDHVEYGYGYGEISDGFQWGVGLEFEFRENSALEIIYQNLQADVYGVDYYNFPVVGEVFEGTATFNYILVGGTQYLPINDVLSGFGSLDIGMTVASPQGDQYDNISKFTWAGRLGLRVKGSGRLSFRVHAQITNPVQAFGGGLYFGTGGVGAGASTYSTIWQFNLGGSVNLRLR